jgi:hypothetical protein
MHTPHLATQCQHLIGMRENPVGEWQGHASLSLPIPDPGYRKALPSVIEPLHPQLSSDVVRLQCRTTVRLDKVVHGYA